MRFAVDYLSRFIEKIPADLSKLKEQLINLGIEVEEVEQDQAGNIMFKVAVAPNRADLLSIIGIARELALTNNSKINLPKITQHRSYGQCANKLKVNLATPTACPKYLARVLAGCKQNIATPSWIAAVLLNAGIKLISPIVDLINYVMLELGQPLHAFDADQVMKQQIKLRLAEQGESIVLLNDCKVTLTPQDLIVADQNDTPLALAGIMGAKIAAITPETKNIILECAYFDPIGIRVTSKRFNLNTESSQRFSRGIDPNLVEVAMERCCDLMMHTFNAKIVDNYQFVAADQLPQNESINLNSVQIFKLLGINFTAEQIRSTLEGLGCTLVKLDSSAWQVQPPTWRPDLKIAADLIEELARHIGYDKITPQIVALPGNFKINENTTDSANFEQELQVKRFWADRGYNEVINYSFIEPSLAQSFFKAEILYELKNPMSHSMAVMRPGLLPGLINTLIYNKNRQIERVKLFEIGTVFQQDFATNKIIEQTNIAGVITGTWLQENWQKINQPANFFTLKNDLVALLQLYNWHDYAFSSNEYLGLHPHNSAQIKLNNIPVGFMGELHPKLLLQLVGNDNPVYGFELNFKELLNHKRARFKHFSAFPSIRRDFAVVVDQTMQVGDLESLIKQTFGDWLQEIVFFDVYIGKQLPSNKKSIAFGVILQHKTRTLIEAEVNAVITEFLTHLSSMGIELRI